MDVAVSPGRKSKTLKNLLERMLERIDTRSPKARRRHHGHQDLQYTPEPRQLCRGFLHTRKPRQCPGGGGYYFIFYMHNLRKFAQNMRYN